MYININGEDTQMQTPLKAQSELIFDNDPLSRRGKKLNSGTQQIDENTESFRNFIRKFRNSPVTKKDYLTFSKDLCIIAIFLKQEQR